ncbi:MAG: flippase-like domain-containing protein [Chryseobacterium sp.]|nr:MAG: flippase-like domain-containing protein [Chryseobacterium sp.]
MRLRHLFFFLALVGIAVLVIIQFGQFQKFLEVVKNVNIWILLIVVGFRYLYYWTNTKYFQAYLHNFKHDIPFKVLFNGVITMNFANTVFPSGGLSGVAILRGQLRKHKVSAHTATVAQGFWYGFTGLSFVVLLLLSLLLLFLSNRIEQVSFRLIMIMLLMLLVATIIAVSFLLNRRIFEKFAYYLTRPTNWILKKFHRNSLGKEQLHELINNLYETLKEFKNDLRLLMKPFWWCFATLVIDIASLYLVFIAFGVAPNPGVVIAAFLIALLASLLSVFTSGIGIYEIGMVSILVGLGLTFDVSFSAAIVYRILALWLFIPIGLYFYKKTMLDEK